MFNVGDKVKCIKESKLHNCTVGKVYSVVKYANMGNVVEFNCIMEDTGFYAQINHSSLNGFFILHNELLPQGFKTFLEEFPENHKRCDCGGHVTYGIISQETCSTWCKSQKTA